MVDRYTLVVVGASAGGVEVLIELASALPPDFGAPVLVVLHVSSDSILPDVLGRVARMPVAHAVHGEALLPGRSTSLPPTTT